MKIITWTDSEGFNQLSRIRDSDLPEDAPTIGIPCGPPDVRQLDWADIARQINNDLVERGLVTWRDVQRSQDGVDCVVRRIVKRQIISLYRQVEAE